MNSDTERTVTLGNQTITIDPRTSSWFWDDVQEGRWEPGTILALERVVGPGTRFVDVGAWIGPLSLLAAGLGATVSAFELDPKALEYLERNLSLNPELAAHITVHPVGLASRSGEATISAPELGTSVTSLVRKGPAMATATLIGVQEAVAAGWLDADVIKIDVEGAEYSLVPALRGHLRTQRPVVILSTHAYHVAERLPERLPRVIRSVLLGLLTLRHSFLVRHLWSYRYWYEDRGGRWVRLPRWKAALKLTRPAQREFLLAPTSLPL